MEHKLEVKNNIHKIMMSFEKNISVMIQAVNICIELCYSASLLRNRWRRLHQIAKKEKNVLHADT